MKNTYNAPEVEIIKFDAEDVITTSLTGKDTKNDITESKPDITIS